MKKLLLILFALLPTSLYAGFFAAECESCSCKTTSHTTFVLRPVYTYTSPELQSLYHRRFQAKEDGWLGVLQLVPLGGASDKNDRLAKYFLPSCNDTLTVTENITPETSVLAEQLGIYTKNGTFSSTVQFKPSHRFAGLGFTWQQTLYCKEDGNRLWLTVSGPYLHVANRIELCERICDDGGGPLHPDDINRAQRKSDCNECCDIHITEPLPVQKSVSSALNQSGWCYGKFNGCTNKKNGFSNLNVVAGLETVNREDAYFSSYIGAVFPTGNRFNAHQVFEPMVGNNDHWGFILGTTANFDLWYWDCHEIKMEYWLDFDVQYFAKRKEIRSFDLKGKPWSRYMQMYSSQEQAQIAFDAQAANPFLALTLATPGINILTQEVDVKPGFNRSFTTGFVASWQCLRGQLGYNFFARQAECVDAPECFPCDVALKSLLGSGQTDIVQQINTNYPQNCTPTPFANYTESIITVNDLDLDSAAHPAVLAHNVFVTLGWLGCLCDHPIQIALGGSYEFSPDNNGLNRWMAWGKFDFSY